jgi:thymidine kinase
MQGFLGSTRLLQIADDIEELKTICKCGLKATQNIRKINGKVIFDGEQIFIDNSQNVEYESVCGKCYLDLLNQK